MTRACARCQKRQQRLRLCRSGKVPVVGSFQIVHGILPGRAVVEVVLDELKARSAVLQHLPPLRCPDREIGATMDPRHVPALHRLDGQRATGRGARQPDLRSAPADRQGELTPAQLYLTWGRQRRGTLVAGPVSRSQPRLLAAGPGPLRQRSASMTGPTSSEARAAMPPRRGRTNRRDNDIIITWPRPPAQSGPSSSILSARFGPRAWDNPMPKHCSLRSGCSDPMGRHWAGR